ncbi:glycosyltransferase [Oenococcus oeni]|uniref:glycosyltransferase n=1 Tax=Oenococcus oeni TaxID=1247 RepID=UPI0008F9425C|nr:glycosyltransferase [Oenococcus oeni]OIM08172.1 hypothetical protein ATX52_07470 [Oenococcus oeni]
MQKKSVGAVVVTYNPDLGLLTKNIESIESNVGKNYLIVDNGSKNIHMMQKKFPTSKIQSFSQNLGIATAQNEGIHFFSQLGFEWVILLDQDSQLPDNAVQKMIKTEVFHNADTGIVGVAINAPRSDARHGVKPENELIASGSFIKIKAWVESGGMDEFLFIDYVDFDFDARVRKCGYKLYINNDIIMKHEIGSIIYAPVLSKLLHRTKGYFSDHSPMRLYYLNRNRIIVYRRYPLFFKDKRNPVLIDLVTLRDIFAFKKTRIEKLRFALRGIIDGLKYSPQQDRNFRNGIDYTHEKN